MKVLKWLAYVVVGTACIAAVATVAAYFASSRRLAQSFAVRVTAPKVSSGAAAIALGEHVATVRGCRDCHGSDLGGNKVVDNGAMGKIYGPNITRGRGGLDAAWTDEDYVRSIRHGIGQNGRGLFLMPSFEYANLSEEDFGALVAYLKSVKPVDRERVPVELGPVARVLTAVGKIKLAAEQIDHANVKAAQVVPAVSVEYGRYLAVGCSGCHGANFSGGKIDIGPPDWPPASNLTPHASGRLAKWSEADFMRVMRERRRPDGSTIDPVMPAVFGQMTDVELKAVWKFLQTVEPVAMGAR